jgi:predicted Zn-dependent protease
MTFRRSLIFFLAAPLLLLLSGCSMEEASYKRGSSSNDLPLGASAFDLLSDDNYTSLSIDLVYVTGYEPTSEALRELELFLEKYVNKPEGISISLSAIPPPGVGSYSLEELKLVEKEHRTAFSSGQNIAVFIFFADDKSETAGQNLVIGKAYKNTSIVIFEKEIRELADRSSSISRSLIEHTTLRHEFGHLFGLVNNGSPAQSDHEDKDPKNRAHCNKEGCLMVASLDFGNSSALDLFKNETPADFDASCRLDLKANGGKYSE